MRPFIYLFSSLLIPVSLLIGVLLAVYFLSDYTFTQAMKLGILYGLFTGTIVSLVFSAVFLLLRERKEKMLRTLQPLSSLGGDINTNVNNKPDNTLMLLMNKELTFAIILTMLKHQVSHPKVSHNIDRGDIDIKIGEESISIAVTPLSKHTSQIIINGIKNSKHIQNIVSLLKEKEHAFLQY